MSIAAQGRLPYGEPIAIIDIGSNSVRLVAYEGLSRSPTPIFNEKVMCGLGKKVLTTGRLSDEAMTKALAALARGGFAQGVARRALAMEPDQAEEMLLAGRHG